MDCIFAFAVDQKDDDVWFDLVGNTRIETATPHCKAYPNSNWERVGGARIICLSGVRVPAMIEVK